MMLFDASSKKAHYEVSKRFVDADEYRPIWKKID